MTKHTHHSETLRPSIKLRAGLLPLRRALIAAEKESPARPPSLMHDRNEQLALQLIEKIKHPHSISLTGLKIEPPQPVYAVFREMAGSDAR